jgi:hypothetical protein
VTEKSGNLRNDLRNDILKAVSSLRKEISNLRSEVEDKNKLIVGLEMKAAELSMHKTLESGVGGNCVVDQGTPSLGRKVNYKNNAWMAPSASSTRKGYSDVLAGRQGTVPIDHNKMYKLFVKSKYNQSAEYIRTLLKTKVNPTQMKVGISAFKTLKNGQVLIEAEKKMRIGGSLQEDK